jgi:uncharacterized protein
VLSIGDSIGADLGQGLSRFLGDRGGFVPRTDARESTGLARPDYFNWPYQIGRDLEDLAPDIVVMMFGANDNQGFLVGDRGLAFGSTGWKAVYRSRVAEAMEQVTANGYPLVWVGMPPMGRGGMSGQMQLLNSIFRSESRRHPGVIYVDSWRVLAGSQGGYSPYLPTSSGKVELVRQPDGIHLTAAGNERLARAVFESMSTLWRRPS